MAIINKTKLGKMTVSKVLKKLVSDGLVVRFESKSDSRAKNVFLTKSGKRLVKQLIPIVEGIDEQFFSVINKGDQKILRELLVNLKWSLYIPIHYFALLACFLCMIGVVG